MVPKTFCPYCFEYFDPRQVLFRCINERCNFVPDLALNHYYNKDMGAQPKVITSTLAGARGPLKNAVCECGKESSKSICPACHNDLPLDFIKSETNKMYFSFIGARTSGKSHFITVLLHEMFNGSFAASYPLAASAWTEATRKRYEKSFSYHIYTKREVIPPTMAGATDPESRHPLIYYLRPTERSWWQKILSRVSQRGASFRMIFFDNAGEDFDHIDTLTNQNRYILQAKGIVFIIDPIQIPAIREQMPHEINPPKEVSDPNTLLWRMMQFIREANDLSESDLIKVPFAIAFSKADLLRHIMPKGSALFRPPEPDGRFNIGDSDEVNGEIKALVNKYIGPGFIKNLEANFKNYRFFGFSALGNNPQGRDLSAGVAPFRVEDPMVWFLYHYGTIKGGK